MTIQPLDLWPPVADPVVAPIDIPLSVADLVSGEYLGDDDFGDAYVFVCDEIEMEDDDCEMVFDTVDVWEMIFDLVVVD